MKKKRNGEIQPSITLGKQEIHPWKHNHQNIYLYKFRIQYRNKYNKCVTDKGKIPN